MDIQRLFIAEKVIKSQNACFPPEKNQYILTMKKSVQEKNEKCTRLQSCDNEYCLCRNCKDDHTCTKIPVTLSDFRYFTHYQIRTSKQVKAIPCIGIRLQQEIPLCCLLLSSFRP